MHFNNQTILPGKTELEIAGVRIKLSEKIKFLGEIFYYIISYHVFCATTELHSAKMLQNLEYNKIFARNLVGIRPQNTKNTIQMLHKINNRLRLFCIVSKVEKINRKNIKFAKLRNSKYPKFIRCPLRFYTREGKREEKKKLRKEWAIDDATLAVN